MVAPRPGLSAHVALATWAEAAEAAQLSEAVIAQLAARRSRNPKVVSSIPTHRTALPDIFRCES